MSFRSLAIVLLLVIVMPILAQEDPVSPAELELSGTPSEICEAATPALDPENRSYSEAQQVLEAGVDYRAVICTSAGAIYVDLLEAYTPQTVNNFIFLAEQNYYNNTIFHRVIEDFMAQAGDPTGTGSGGPGYQFDDEIVGFLSFDRPGLLAMANAGPATNGSQFFITTTETTWLNGAHTIFGEVLEGQSETVDNILLRDPAAGGDATTLDTVVIIRDPELVESTFVDESELATAEDFIAGLDVLLEEGALPPDISAQGAFALETSEVAALAPEELLDAYTEFLENYGHTFRVSSVVDNADCNSDYFFVQMVYSVDAFASAEDASAALSDDFLPEYYEAVEYTAIDMGDRNISAYSAETEVCGEGDLAMVVDIQRGRYIANISVIYPAAIAAQFDMSDLANITTTTIAQIFEAGLGSAYRSELR